MPGGVREVVAQRLARLSPACRAMLDVAAVAGAEVRLDVLARTLSGHDDLPDLVAEAVRARILVRPLDELAPLGFAHDLFREVLGAMLSPAIKAQLHLTLARTLDQLRADGVPIAHASVAAHYVGAASLGLRPAALEAVRHSQQAALDAAGQLAFEDAAGHLRRALAALQLADHPAASVRLDLLLSLGVAPRSRRRRHRSPRGARRGGRSRPPARRHRRLRPRRHRHPPVGCAERPVTRPQRAAARRGQQQPRRPVLAVAGPGAGQPGPRAAPHLGPRGRTNRAREVAVEAVDVARSLDDPSTLAYCLLALHDTSWSVGSAGERLPIVAEMLDLARLAGDRELHAQAQLLKATALLELGDPAAPAELERYCRAAEDLGHARGRWGALSRRAVLALLAGQLDEAATLGAAAARLGEEIGEPDTPGVRDTLLWELARFRGGWSDFVTEGHWVPPGTWPPIRAVLLTARGDRPAAQSALAGYSLEQDRRHGVRRHDGWMPVIITEAVVSVGTRGPARRGVRLAAPAGRPPPRLRRLHGLRRRRRPPPRHARRRARPPRRRRHPPATPRWPCTRRSGPSPGPRSTGRCSPTTYAEAADPAGRAADARQHPAARGRRLAGHVPRADIDGTPRQGDARPGRAPGPARP